MATARRLALVAFALSAMVACTAAQPPVPTPVYRDTTAQIASQTDVTAARMEGQWVLRQGYASDINPPSALTFAALPGGGLQMTVPVVTCDTPGCIEAYDVVRLTATGPGRWTAAQPQRHLRGGEVWVMWMDFDSRTMALGTPSGAFGLIFDRARTGGADRITAAREIMDWFGYDMDALRPVAVDTE